MVRLYRDITWEGGSFAGMSLKGDEDFEALVKEKYPNAYIDKFVKKGSNVYRAKVKTGIFSSKVLGDTHFFQDQVWKSAYIKMKEDEYK